MIEVHGTQIVARRGEEIKARDAQFCKKVTTEKRVNYQEIRDRQARQRREDDYYPDIGEAGTQTKDPAPGDSQAAEDRHQTQSADHPVSGTPQDRTRKPVRESWSFQPPRTWPVAGPSKRVTRAESSRRERDRARTGARSRTMERTRN